jgi:hypothetical protein
VDEALLPEVHERAPVGAVGRFEGAKIGLTFRFGFGREDDAREVETAEEFQKEEADGATVEILERMDAEEAALGEGKELEREVAGGGRGARPPGPEVVAIVAHEAGDLMRGRREQTSDADFDATPTPGPIRDEVVADTAVKLRRKPLVERCGGEIGRVEGLLRAQDALGEQRGYFRVGEETAAGFEIAGGAVRACISRRVLNATGSRSKAMLWATSTGIASQRRRSFSAGVRLRHWLMAWVHVTGHRFGSG